MADQESFDFIVVGAGAAGCATAARLAGAGKYTVLLLEAGSDDSWIWLKVPLGVGKVLVGERALWRYTTQAEPGLAGRRIFWPRGRVLGGTSTINGMLWVRGDPSEYDNWAAMGNTGWSFAELLPYFQKIENTELGEEAFRGRKGPMHIDQYGPKDPLSGAFLDACAQAGFSHNPDYNGASYEGAGMLQLNTRRGLRHGAREAYLRPASELHNLSVRCDTLVNSVVLQDGRAKGVKVSVGGETRQINARHEVIVAGGTINSPQLLELSGIGDSERLKAVGVTPHHHLPGVGEGLRDHLHTRLSFRCTQPITLNDIMRNPLRQALFGLGYLFKRDGLMSCSTATAHALVRSRTGLDRPDLKLQMHPLSAGDTRNPNKVEFDPFSGFGIGSFALRPQATGSVHINSNDPRQHPTMLGNYLGHPEDVETAIAGVKLARRLAAQPALSTFIQNEQRPGPDIDKDEEILDFIRQNSNTSYHPIGSCRMGVDAKAVVDPTLKVKGLAGLRVADASIFPTMPSANSHAPAIMVGEVAAALALRDAQ